MFVEGGESDRPLPEGHRSESSHNRTDSGCLDTGSTNMAGGGALAALALQTCKAAQVRSPILPLQSNISILNTPKLNAIREQSIDIDLPPWLNCRTEVQKPLKR